MAPGARTVTKVARACLSGNADTDRHVSRWSAAPVSAVASSPGAVASARHAAPVAPV